MSEPPSSGPLPLLAQLAQPSKTYRRGVWLAVASLALFLVVYFLLAGWFLVTAYQVTLGADAFDPGGAVVGLCALFFAVFMLKAVFFVRRGGSVGRIEVTREVQPRLFAFLDDLADRAQAPRPHKVFLSPQVNAAVFYDLSPLNLIVPSKKNIEIGLALVNVLSLGEFRAVVAHEFGHVTQRSMVVGQWASIAEQVAGALVARRDKLDAVMDWLSRVDLRVAWVGWLLRLIVWSIRSLVDTTFGLVLRLQRALSREMEFHADLVAVSVTGSDAIIHALLRLQAADDSWSRTRAFVLGRHAQKQDVRDAFTLHALMQTRMEDILHDLEFGRVPPVPADRPAEHRVFKATLAQPPQMWVTHPSNDAREANAKRHYVAAPIEQDSAWALFDNPEQVREGMTALLLQSQGQEPEPMAESVAALQRQMGREYLDRRYRGVYVGRSVVRCAARPDALVGPPPENWRGELERLYPEDLIADVARWRTLSQEVAQLRALQSGALQPAGGVIRYRGENIAVKTLPRLIERVEREAGEVEQRLLAGDRTRRSVHLAAAAAVGNGWDAYLSGILRVLHYADHTVANLDDLQGQLAYTVRVVSVTGRVGRAGRQRVVDDANALHGALGDVFGVHGGSRLVVLDAPLAERLDLKSWDEYVGRYALSPPDSQNLGQWLNVIDGWVAQARGAYAALSAAALEELLLTEAALAAHVRAGTTPDLAPAPSRVPEYYDVLVAGAERKRQARFSWWQRVQIAHGAVPTIVRLALAAGIVVAVLGFGRLVNTATVTVYNGLALPVDVRLGDQHLRLRARSAESATVRPHGTLQVETRAATAGGPVVERFAAPIPGSLGHYVYDVGGSTPLMEWTALYGPDQPAVPEHVLGNPRWSKTSADVLFEDPPHSIETSGGGETRLVLAALDGMAPEGQIQVLQSDSDRVRLIEMHIRWDLTTSRDILYWIEVGASIPDLPGVLAARLATAPNDVVLLRARQDAASPAERAGVCEHDQQRSTAAPDNGDLRYVALRCIDDPAARLVAMREGLRRWPDNAWFGNAVGYGEADLGRWPQAIATLEAVRLPALMNVIALDLARMHRLVDDDPSGAVTALAQTSQRLRRLRALESGQGVDSVNLAYRALALGELDSALARAQPDTAMEARLVRLAAASDGATPDLIARALALPPTAGVDDFTRWAGIGLAARLGRPFTQFLDSSTVGRRKATERMLGFIDLSRRGGDLRGADSALTGVGLVLRAEAYSVAVIILGRRAPAAWRRAAKRLLFAPERPYFR